MESDIIQYRLDCPLDNQEVSPLVCKRCDRRLSCTEVSKLGSTADIDKWKGTILGGGVNLIAEFRKGVQNFILEINERK